MKDELGKTPLYKACSKGRLGVANVSWHLDTHPTGTAPLRIAESFRISVANASFSEGVKGEGAC